MSSAPKSTNHVFAAFLDVSMRCQAWMRPRTPAAFGYSAEVLLDRLTQLLIEISILPYTLAAHATLQASNEFPGAATRIAFPEAAIHVGSGRVSTSPLQWARNVFAFLAHWSYCLATIVAGFFRRGSISANRPATILVDAAEEHIFVEGNDARFVEYCRRGPITPLRVANRLFTTWPTRRESSAPEFITYAPNPLLALLREASLGASAQAQLLARHVWLLLSFLWAAIRAPHLTIIARELAYTPIAFALDRGGVLEAMVMTNSIWAAQPLWTRSFTQAKTHMLWYSQAPHTMMYDTDDVKGEPPHVRWIRVDTHWVWTHSMADYLRARGQAGSTIEVIGPILWYLPELRTPPPGEISVLVFDVPALGDNTMLMLGEITNNFHPDKMRQFMADVVALRLQLEQTLGRPVSIHLKRKRTYRPQYSREYFDFITKLAEEGVVMLYGPAENIYSIVSASHLVISYPYTSAAYVAEALGVPSLYYDPTRKLMPEYFPESKQAVRFASGVNELTETALQLLGHAARVPA